MPSRNTTYTHRLQGLNYHGYLHVLKYLLTYLLLLYFKSDDPTNNVTALEDNGWSTRSRDNPTRFSSLKSKVQNVTTKKLNIYSTMETEDTEALRR